MAERDGLASEHLRVEARHSTFSLWRKTKSYAFNLLSAVISGPDSWPPVDIVLIDLSTGDVLKTWYEGGDDASILLSVLNEQLAEMPYGEFLEKWDISSEP